MLMQFVLGPPYQPSHHPRTQTFYGTRIFKVLLVLPRVPWMFSLLYGSAITCYEIFQSKKTHKQCRNSSSIPGLSFNKELNSRQSLFLKDKDNSKQFLRADRTVHVCVPLIFARANRKDVCVWHFGRLNLEFYGNWIEMAIWSRCHEMSANIPNRWSGVIPDIRFFRGVPIGPRFIANWTGTQKFSNLSVTWKIKKKFQKHKEWSCCSQHHMSPRLSWRVSSMKFITFHSVARLSLRNVDRIFSRSQVMKSDNKQLTALEQHSLVLVYLVSCVINGIQQNIRIRIFHSWPQLFMELRSKVMLFYCKSLIKG